MHRFVPLAVILLLAGFAAAHWLPFAGPGQATTAPNPVAPHFDAALPIEQRLLELERAVSEERQARQLLQEELVYLTAELDELRPSPRFTASDASETGSPDAVAVTTSGPAAETSRRRARLSRSEQLVAAGFAPDRAAWIEQREAQLQLELLDARYEAQRSGDYDAYRQLRERSGDVLRDELGPTDYERYLEGIGRPTTITVSSVMDGSPAQRAGLRPGDEIVSYGGRRTYSMSDLSDAIVDGQPGQTVLVNIVRDGIPMQVALPRGAVGISGGGRRNR
jgi:uncharacterized coiled-coil protein SlyX